MDINIIYSNMINTLNENGYKEIVSDLEMISKIGVTSSEILSLTGKLLFDLKKNNIQAYNLIENDISSYIEYCKNYGIIIR